MKEFIATIVLVTTGCMAAAQEAAAPPGAEASELQEAVRSEFLWLDAPEGRIGGRAYINAGIGDQPMLVIVLHGDLLQPDDPYHYSFARMVAAQASNVVVVGLLRPGYSDEQGNRSDGEILNATGDNYTPEVVEAVAVATRQLSNRYGAGATALIGHSGGAAISALVLGRYPDVADAALLVACPCDLRAWREHMMGVRPDPVWQQEHRGLSPMNHTAGVRPTSIVELMVGDEDEVVRLEYSHEYAAALQAQGGDAHVTVLPGFGHNILLRPAVLSMTNRLLAKLKGIDRAPE